MNWHTIRSEPDVFGYQTPRAVASDLRYRSFTLPTPLYDVDLYFHDYDASCTLLGSATSAAAGETATLPPDTHYVLSQLWLCANVPITLTATDTR